MAILFLTLKTFASAGGVEKVGRVAGKAVYDYSEGKDKAWFYSMYDSPAVATEPYLPAKFFKGFNGNKILFTLASIRKGFSSNIIILTHVKLWLPAYIVKKIFRKTRIILIAHGIEVWEPLPAFTTKMLRSCDVILPVSRFTKERMKTLFHIPERQFSVLNNCLDPFLPKPVNESNRHAWREKYGFKEGDVILMTLTRLTIREKNKGYDKILKAMQTLQASFPNLKYLFVGKYELAEKERLEKLIEELELNGKVVFTGFVPDEELADHYNICDVYVMPSEKEGFGISFIEALYYGKPVIAGNRDGTVDALLDGRLGLLVDPGSQESITNAIEKVIRNLAAFAPDRALLLEHFSYDVYKERWREVLED